MKRQDPGCFTITCNIGGQKFGKVLCDSGASINLMPLSIFNRLNIGTIRSITMTLQMVDRLVTYPRGIVDNVLVKVDKFIFPADFVVLDMEEDKNIPLILGRPFLATGAAMINVQNGELSLRVHDDKVSFSITEAMKQHDSSKDDCLLISDTILHDEVIDIHSLFLDHLDLCIQNSTVSTNTSSMLSTESFEYSSILDNTQQQHEDGEVKYLQLQTKEEEEEVYNKTTQGVSKRKDPPTLDLKPLPDHLKYAFLGPNDTYPVIIAASLNEVQQESLLRVSKHIRKP